MTLILTLGHLVALGTGAVVAAILVATVVSSRLKDARTDAKIARSWGESYKLRLDTEHAWHLEAAGFNSEIRVHLKKRESDARVVAGLRKGVIDQQRDEIRTLNQLVTGAGEKLAGLNVDLAAWAAFGLELTSWGTGPEENLTVGRPRLREILNTLNALLARSEGLDFRTSVAAKFTGIEETTSDEEAGPEDDTREVAAVQT